MMLHSPAVRSIPEKNNNYVSILCLYKKKIISGSTNHEMRMNLIPLPLWILV